MRFTLRVTAVSGKVLAKIAYYNICVAKDSTHKKF